jgi:spermidine synthase
VLGGVATNEGPRAGIREVRFGTAELSRDPRRRGGWLLRVDGLAQSYVDLDDPTHLEFPYLRHMAVALHCVTGAPAPLTAVHVGGAGCTLPRYLAVTRPGSTQVVVDADGELMDLVHAEFGAVPGLSVLVGDGRAYLESRPAGSADLVVVDAFEGASCVGRVVTVEATRRVAELLRPDGVEVVNVIDAPGARFARRVVATMAAVHESVLVLTLPAMLTGAANANVVVVGARTLPAAAIARLAGLTLPTAACLTGESLAAFHAPARPLTDAEPTDGPASVRPVA